MTDMVVTSGAAWRTTEIKTLPSGKVARLRKPDVIDLIMGDGTIPDALTPIIMAGLKGEQVTDQIDWAKLTPEQIAGLFGLLNKVAAGAFVEPRIVDKPESEMGDGEIGIEHVEFNDKNFVFSWAMGADGGKAARFPSQPAGSVGPISTDAHNQTKRSGDPRRGKAR